MLEYVTGSGVRPGAKASAAFIAISIWVALSSTGFGEVINVKLHGPLPSQGSIKGSINCFRISPDASLVVFGGDIFQVQDIELFSVPPRGGTPVKLSGPVPSMARGIADFSITRDSQTVVYVADQETPGQRDVFVVPIIGGVNRKLNSGNKMVVGSSPILITPDDTRLIFWATPTTTTVSLPRELYSVPLASGPQVKISGAIAAGGLGVRGRPKFRVSSDSQNVVFVGDMVTFDLRELYSVPVTGGARVKLNPTVSHRIEIVGFTITPDGSKVVYIANNNTVDVFELFVVPITGGPSSLLSGTLVPGGDVIGGLVISSDSQHVMFRARRDIAGLEEIYSARIDAGAITKLHPDLTIASEDTTTDTSNPALSPDGSYAVVSVKRGAGIADLYVTTLDGGSPVRIGPDFLGVHQQIQILQDSSRIIFIGFRGACCNGQKDLFSIKPDGTDLIELTNSAPRVQWAFVSPDSTRIFYGERTIGGLAANQLFSIPVGGGPIRRLDKAPGDEMDIQSTSVGHSGDGNYVVFRGDQDTNGPIELFAAYSTPEIDAIEDRTVAAGSPSAPINFGVFDVETAAENLIVNVSSSDQALIPDGAIQLSGTGALRTIVVTPEALMSGSVTLTVTVTDEFLEVTEQTVNLMVENRNGVSQAAWTKYD